MPKANGLSIGAPSFPYNRRSSAPPSIAEGGGSGGCGGGPVDRIASEADGVGGDSRKCSLTPDAKGRYRSLRALSEDDEEQDEASGSRAKLWQAADVAGEHVVAATPEYREAFTTPASLDLASLRDLLRCVGCRRFLFPPITQCLSGHMQCKGCLEASSLCARCDSKVTEVPPRLAEMITEQFKVQCSYVDKGCTEIVAFKSRREHEEVCPFKPVQCPEFDCTVLKPMSEIFRHFRMEHHHHFVNAHGNNFHGDIRCDDANMVMGVERKWAPTMMKLELGDELHEGDLSACQHFFLEIVRTKHGVWHMWVWHLGEPDASALFRTEVAIRRKDSELKFAGRVHSIRIPPHRVVATGSLLSFSDYSAAHFRYIGDQGHPVIDYRVNVHSIKKVKSSERVITKMLRRFSIDSGGGGSKAHKPNMEALTGD